jgi:REP element-mobilizing transposase RayT
MRESTANLRNVSRQAHEKETRARARFTSPGVYGERKRNFTGQHFWARGYFVSTVGRDEAVIREYIQHQEAEAKRLDQMKLSGRR